MPPQGTLTSRLLPPEEWPRLRGTLLDPAWQDFTPTDQVLVVEDGGEIVGCVALFQRWHLEGCWLAPEHRGGVAAARHLWRRLKVVWRALGQPEVISMAATPESRRLVEKVGTARLMDCAHYSIRMEN